MAGKILLSGATGYIAAHSLDVLLNKGYKVVGTIRSHAKADALVKMNKIRQEAYRNGQLVFEEVPDISAHSAFDHVFEKHSDLTGVLHLASPFTMKVKKPEDLIEPAVNGTHSILLAASKSEKINRVVVMSSFAAIGDPSKLTIPSTVFTENDWFPLSKEIVIQSGDLALAYLGSKTYAEREAWNFIKEHKTSFDLAVLNPPMVFGPIAHHINKLSNLNESVSQIWQLLNQSGGDVPITFIPWFVDVRDLAQLAVQALDLPLAGGNRYIAAGGKYTNDYVAKLATEEFPSMYKGPKYDPSNLHPESFTLDTSKIKRDFDFKFRPANETFHDMVAQLYEFESQGL